MQFENNKARLIKGDGDWELELGSYVIPYHPKHAAIVECMLAVCRRGSKVVGLMADIRNITAAYKKEEYDFAIRVVLWEVLLDKFFEDEDMEIPF